MYRIIFKRREVEWLWATTSSWNWSSSSISSIQFDSRVKPQGVRRAITTDWTAAITFTRGNNLVGDYLNRPEFDGCDRYRSKAEPPPPWTVNQFSRFHEKHRRLVAQTGVLVMVLWCSRFAQSIASHVRCDIDAQRRPMSHGWLVDFEPNQVWNNW